MAVSAGIRAEGRISTGVLGMGSFSIWHWLILLIFFVLPAVLVLIARRRTNQNRPADVVGPYGFGGWLTILAYGQTVGPIATLLTLLANAPTYGGLIDQASPNGALTAYLEITFMLVVFVVQIITTVVMYRRKVYFPQMFIVQWVVMLLDEAAIRVMNVVLLGAPWPTMIESTNYAQDAAPVIGAIIWISYALQSVRVRNTFVR